MDTKIVVGMGGWELHPFNKYFYPRNMKKGFRKLHYYCQYFDTVEVNATFYNTALSPRHAQRWVEDVSANENFIFTVKLYRGFTHTFDATREDLLAVCRLLDELAGHGKLGGLVVQFPDSFGFLPQRREYLEKLGQAFRPYTLFLELRHRSWFTESMYAFFQDSGIHLLNVDLPMVKQQPALQALSWNGRSYFRMMGRNKGRWSDPWRMEDNGKYLVSDRYHYFYCDEELEELVRLIEQVKPRAEVIFVIFHNDPEANSLVNGFQLRKKLQARTGGSVPNELVVRNFGEKELTGILRK